MIIKGLFNGYFRFLYPLFSDKTRLEASKIWNPVSKILFWQDWVWLMNFAWHVWFLQYSPIAYLSMNNQWLGDV